MLHHAQDCIARCRALARYSEVSDCLTRTFLSEPMRDVHQDLSRSMQAAGMTVRVDGAGNLRGRFEAEAPGAPTLFIGSHLDTVPNAGAFDGILGVVLGIKLVELLERKRKPFGIEIVGFSEEEGVRFGFPFIGSKAFIGECPEDARVLDAIHAFGLNPTDSSVFSSPALGYLEFHIEQGPVLESLHRSLGVVETIVGQTRMTLTFVGRAGHAGTTPMHLRKDALCGAAQWICEVEQQALDSPGVVATVGRMEALPNAPNVVPEAVMVTFDARHRDDSVRREFVARLVSSALEIARGRNLRITSELRLDQPAVAMDPQLTTGLSLAAERAGYSPHRMLSGAGHDAMIVAQKMPAAMLFLRSPGGLSHHPGETVLPEDVAAALATGLEFFA